MVASLDDLFSDAASSVPDDLSSVDSDLGDARLAVPDADAQELVLGHEDGGAHGKHLVLKKPTLRLILCFVPNCGSLLS
jgi:hypothetical protein